MKNKPIKEIRNIFIIDVYICFGRKEAKEIYNQYYNDGSELVFNENADAETFLFDKSFMIIYLSKSILKSTSEELIALSSHEAYHAAENIKEYIGEESKSEEVTAYLIQCIMRNIVKKLVQSNNL